MGTTIHATVDETNARRFENQCARLGTTPGAIINDLMSRFDADDYRRQVGGNIPKPRRRGPKPGQRGPFASDGSLKGPRPPKDI